MPNAITRSTYSAQAVAGINPSDPGPVRLVSKSRCERPLPNQAALTRLFLLDRPNKNLVPPGAHIGDRGRRIGIIVFPGADPKSCMCLPFPMPCDDGGNGIERACRRASGCFARRKLLFQSSELPFGL